MLPTASISVELIDSMGSDINVVNAARVSFAKEVQELDLAKDTKLLQYLAKHQHWSPFAHTCITVRCKVPLFLARQLVKHQVGGNWNEESRRYIDGPVEFYVPKELHLRPTNVKQGAGSVHPASDYYKYVLETSSMNLHGMYNELIQHGVAPEEARMVLPLNTMTNFIWSGSLLFFDRVIRQRKDSHAQLIAQDFAKKLEAVVHPLYPCSYAALEKAHDWR